jgi:hypothetical protein
MTREASSLSLSFRSIRLLFEEHHANGSGVWACRLCVFTYREETCPTGWPLTLNGLLKLTQHCREHAAR